MKEDFFSKACIALFFLGFSSSEATMVFNQNNAQKTEYESYDSD